MSMRGGIAQSAYAERIGVSHSTGDPTQGYDPEVAEWHDFFKQELPSSIQEPIRLAYLVPGPEKRKYDVGGSSAYYAKLKMAIETAHQMFGRHRMRAAA